MKLSIKLGAGVMAISIMAGVSACGGGEPAVETPAAPQHIIDAVKGRHANFSDVGAAFKAISDEMKAGRPESATVEFSIKALKQYSNSVETWFPEGSGPASGIEMEAKASIWTESEAFAKEIADFQAAIAGLSEATGNPELLPAKFRAAGGTCKSCHDAFREEK